MKRKIRSRNDIWQYILYLIGRGNESSNEGTTLVEFALISGPLFLLLCGTLDNILISIARVSLDMTLQSLAYEASSAPPAALKSILSGQSLCQKSAAYFIDCSASSKFCFSATGFDISTAPDLPASTCAGETVSVTASQCCYLLIAQYQWPLQFDLAGRIMNSGDGGSSKILIRSVALVSRN